MSERLADLGQRPALLREPGREGMPEIVEAEVLDPATRTAVSQAVLKVSQQSDPNTGLVASDFRRRARTASAFWLR